MKTFISMSLLVVLAGCGTRRGDAYKSYIDAISSGEPQIIDNRSMKGQAGKAVNALFENDAEFTPHETLAEQLKRTACTINLQPVGIRSMTPAEIYQARINSVVMVGVVHHCKSEKCKKNHFNSASGVIIHEDGVVLTNYHVVNGKTTKPIAMAVRTFDGRAFLVDEVLAADELNDVAILKLKGAMRLPAAPVFRDEPVGNPVTLITHPASHYYTLTQGYISRYSKEDKGRLIMNVTADYAKGSSGGPVFNNRGDVVGLVSSTRSIDYTTVPLSADSENDALMLRKKGKPLAEYRGQKIALTMNHQMTFKNTVPSRCILDLIKQ